MANIWPLDAVFVRQTRELGLTLGQATRRLVQPKPACTYRYLGWGVSVGLDDSEAALFELAVLNKRAFQIARLGPKLGSSLQTPMNTATSRHR